jgi:hypothetical protein
MDREAIRARFDRIKQRALKKADEEMQREQTRVGKIDTGAEGPIARWPQRPPRRPKRIGHPRHRHTTATEVA